jgi:hypothetical protein
MLLLIILLVLLFPAVVDTTAILAGALEVDSESSVRSWSSSWCCICSECCAEPRTCRNTRKIPSRHLGHSTRRSTIVSWLRPQDYSFGGQIEPAGSAHC